MNVKKMGWYKITIPLCFKNKVDACYEIIFLYLS